MTPAMISAVEAYFLNAMLAEYPLLKLYMSGQSASSTIASYARLWVIASDEPLPAGIGRSARSRNVGLVQVNVYGPKDRGAGETGDVAHFIRNLFHRFPLEVTGEGWVIFKDAAEKDLGDVGEEHIYTMRVPYRFDIAA